jgi:hypothetical protein
MDEFVEMGHMYVFIRFRCFHVLMQPLAFFGIIDLLSVVPYFIELLLHQDTVCLTLLMIIPMTSLRTPVNIVPVLDLADVPFNPSFSAISL